MTTKLHDFFEAVGKLMERAILAIYPVASTDHQTVITFRDPPTAPTSPVEKSSTQSGTQTHLEVFCTAIKQMEGANPANNNPGNCRCSPVGYLPKYGNVTCNPHNFAVFPTYALGWEYLNELVHHRVSLHPDWTFVDFFNVYAPSSDANDPTHYAGVVAKACGVPVDSKVSDYLAC